MDALEALLTRTAAPRLTDPVPSKEQLELIYKAALRAPDHGMLRSWRYLVVEGDARHKLGELFVEAMQPPNEVLVQKLLNAPLRAPMIIIAVATIVEHPKIPAVEQIGSVAAAIQNMSVAIHALGFASIWRTGPPAFNSAVKLALGLKTTDEIVGLLYLGTAKVEDRPVPELNIDDYFQQWP
tara:strand:+ start:802 stop:1347 length:546 start_codon:yes stop_codon:yes gene_type:complete